MRLTLLNYVVGLGSFWNFAAPAIAIALFLVGFLFAAFTKRPGASRVGLAVAAVGIVAFVVASAVDGARNVHDVNELGSAVHGRYGVNLDYAQAVALFGSGATGRPTVAGQVATEYGSTDVVVDGKAATVSLDQFADGSFVLTSKGQELPVAK